MNKKISDVRITTDYSIFKFNSLNREVKQQKVDRLKPSLVRTNGNIQSVLIDSRGNIIDGQHRVKACQELNLPVRYEYSERRFNSDDVLELNNNQSKWTPAEYAESHAKKGNVNYQIFLKYHALYPGLKEGVLACILENKYTLQGNTTGSMSKRGFASGQFVVCQEPKAKLILSKLAEISTFYKGYNKRAFVYAIIHLANQSKFDFDKFITKLKIRHVSLFDFPKAEDFVKVLTEIYNYRERSKLDFTIK